MDNGAHNEFDVIVIGGGPVGENAADRAVQGGLSAVVVESELVGGECSYWACMPSKALIRPATALNAAKNVAGAAQAVTGSLDVSQVFKRRNSFTSDWQDDGQVAWLDGAGISLVRGRGSLAGEKQVRVVGEDGTDRTLVARKAVVIATGSAPTVPPLPGLDGTPYWGTREATGAQEVPESLAVIGGGVAGTELAQVFARLGSAVTMIIRGRLLSGVPQEAAELVRDALKADGVTVLENASSEAVTYDAGRFSVRTGSAEVVAEKLLMATGRHPDVEHLGLDSVGLHGAGKSGLKTDHSGQVEGTDWLWAVGDAAGKVLLTHQGKYEARITGDAIVARAAGRSLDDGPWGKHAQTANDCAVPQTIFTDPEVAQVGWSTEQAKDRGVAVAEIAIPLSVAGSALLEDGYTGWAQLVIDEKKRTVVGACFAGPDVAELLHAATIAIVSEVRLERLWHAVAAYPTVSEIWLRFLEKLGL